MVAPNEDDAGEADMDQTVVRQPILARVPEWVVPLGAGALFASTLITFGATIFAAYSLMIGQYYGFEPHQIGLASLQFTLATVLQAAGVYFARKRVRWMIVMLAAILGSLTFLALPFSLVALVCIGVGRYHFAQATPIEWLQSE